MEIGVSLFIRLGLGKTYLLGTPDDEKTKTSAKALDIAIGEFPFPLSDGPYESRYLTWVVGHKNSIGDIKLPIGTHDVGRRGPVSI
jgi:hypothetical protein